MRDRPTQRTIHQETLIPDVLFEQKSDDAPYWDENIGRSEGPPETRRASVGADIDGDGFDEIVTLFVDEPEIRLQVIDRVDGSESDYKESTYSLFFSEPDTTSVVLTGGDFDGNGADDLALGFVRNSVLKTYLAFADESGDMEVDITSEKTYSQVVDESSMTAVFESGNLDHDNPHELALIVNELTTSGTPTAASRLFLYDDWLAGFIELKSGPISGFDEQTQSTYTAKVADLAMGDIDGDNIDELLVGGLTEFARNCDPMPHLLLAYDDIESASPLGDIGVRYFEHHERDCPHHSPWLLRFVHINVFDLDGDGVAEVLANQFLFDDWLGSPWTELCGLPDDEILGDDTNHFYDKSNSVIAVGDVNGDGWDNIITFSQGTDEIRIWGYAPVGDCDDDGTADFEVVRMGTIPNIVTPTRDRINPVIIPVNTDADPQTTVIQYSEGEYQLVFTEPVVIAALAAPPCGFGIGQNTDACRASFGTTDSQGGGRGKSLEISGSVSVGFSKSLTKKAEREVKHTVTGALRFAKSDSYNLTKSVIFTTAPNEDTVVFTTTPIDKYTYTILSHPDPEVVGEEILILLPREPITLQADRDFYNDHVIEGSLLIDDEIFSHEVGNLDSYPTAGRKDFLLNQWDKVGKEHLRVEAGPQAVGQSSIGSETTLSIEYSEEQERESALSIGYQYERETTLGGLIWGWSVGFDFEASMSITTGSGTVYTGAVGTLDDDNFAENLYEFGLFVYVQSHNATGQEFQVINFWVEK